ncbi:MAG: hypothetical protein ACYC2U_07720 [Candidatus Amoebophilus sp.]
MNALNHAQQQRGKDYNVEIAKLRSAQEEKGQQASLAPIQKAYQDKVKDLQAKQDTIIKQIEQTLLPNRLPLIQAQKKLIEKMLEEAQAHQLACSHIEKPAQSLLANFYNWKRSTFHKFIKLYLGKFFITYEALALGTVARQPEAYELAIQGAVAIGGAVSSAFLPFGDLVISILGIVVEKVIDYAQDAFRKKSAQIGKLYGHQGLEGMEKLAQETADGLTYQLKDAILDLKPEGLEQLAKVAATQMIDYAVNNLGKDENRPITNVALLLQGTKHKPSWLEKLLTTAIIKKEDDQIVENVWLLLSQGAVQIPDEKGFIRAARIFAKQAHKYGSPLLSHAGQITPSIIKLAKP